MNAIITPLNLYSYSENYCMKTVYIILEKQNLLCCHSSWPQITCGKDSRQNRHKTNCVNMIYLVSTKGGVKVAVSIPFGVCSPRSVVKFSPVSILIPGSHEGNRSSHRTKTKALVSWGLLPGFY